MFSMCLPAIPEDLDHKEWEKKMIYAVNEEGIQELRSTAGRLSESAENVLGAVEVISGVTDEYMETIGPHKNSLDEAVASIAKCVTESAGPVAIISEKLNAVADGYEDIMGEDPFSGLSGYEGITAAGSAGAAIIAGTGAGNATGGVAGLESGKAVRSVIETWPRLNGPHTATDDVEAINPNFGTGIQWVYNCQRCVVAYELRRRGYNVRATSIPTVTKQRFLGPPLTIPDNKDHLYHAPFDAWIPPDAIHCPKGQLDIEDHMKEWGNGARAEVLVLWRGQHGNGHVFVAEQINGVTHFLDPQSGKDFVGYHFDDAIPDQIYICRTDNKDLSEYVLDCCQ